MHFLPTAITTLNINKPETRKKQHLKIKNAIYLRRSGEGE